MVACASISGVGSGSDVGSGMFVSDGVTSSSVFAGLSSLSGVLQLVISTMKSKMVVTAYNIFIRYRDPFSVKWQWDMTRSYV